MEAVRPASVDDAAVLGELAAACRSELEGRRGGRLWSVHEADPDLAGTLVAALGDPDWRIVVGTWCDVVVAAGAVRRVPLRDGSTLGVVELLHVAEEFREVSVGEVVMDDLLDWARAAGCRAVDALALPGMRETKNFFERFGMKARSLRIAIDLDDQSQTGEGDDEL